MKKCAAVLYLVVVITFFSTAFGDTIANDFSDGYALISGSVSFQEPSVWTADVNYAVYAPDYYPGSHPDKVTNYIYAYQIFNGASGTAALSSFSVGLEADAGAANPDSDNTYGTLNGESPLLSRLVGSGPTSVQWSIDLDLSEYSTVLLFSSPYSYTFKSATLANGGAGDTQLMPSPIPEPATICLLSLGALAVLRKRKR